MTPRFVHLHLHSEYSLTDSTIRIPELVSRCAALGLPAVAVTDVSNLFALVKFQKAAEGAGVKPIAGADLWIAGDGGPPSRLTLLCLDRSGYLSLSRLISRAFLDGHCGDHVEVQPEWLHADSAGLVAIAGRESALGQALAGGRDEQAARVLREWIATFPDRLYLELTRTGRDGEEAFNTAALALAAKHDLPVLASNDVRFLAPDDFEAHEARVCIATGRVLDDPKRPREFSREQYLKSPEEMAELFADLPEALENTVQLAMRCNLELSLGKYYLPDFPVPEGHTLESWIRAQAHDGLQRRLERIEPAPGRTPADYVARLDTELDVIVTMGFPGYFLIVADFIVWSKSHGIPVGPGRGSGAGSLVAYALGITDLDPLRYDLLFERFLNPERVSMPDFDIDFCMDGRDEVIDYVAGKYGRDKVSQIITYGTMAAKAAIRDCGRVLGHPYGFVDGVAKLIPNTLGISLDDALGLSDAARKDSELASAELIQRYRDEEDVRDLIDLARSLEDLTRNAGKHAGGVVIAPTPLTDFSPLFADPPAKDQARSIVTQFDKDDVEGVGLVKFDFLGLRTLTIIHWAVQAIDARHARAGLPPVDVLALPLDDPATYALLSKGQTTAVFQFESRGMKEYIRKLQPSTFEDLIALAALYRPGPLGAGMVDDFIDRRHGRAEVSYPHDLLEPILKPTYGVIVYQEQVMQIAQVLAGYSLGGADLLRRAMGKKKPEEMAKERVKFEAGAAERGIDADTATRIFDLMEKFADYGFNKSHSAAYALVAYQTAWLKAHYPAEFMAATLTSDMDNTDKVVTFLEEAREIGLTVLPPDVNASDHAFVALDAKTIRYGLGAVKGVGFGACDAIVRARLAGGEYRDLLDFCTRVDSTKLNRRVLEALVHAGALDGLGANRPSLLLQVPEVMRATEQMARERAAGQASLFGGGGDAAPPLRLDLPEVPDWPLETKLLGERDTLGHYLSGHPVDPWRDELQGLVGVDLRDLDTLWSQKKDRRGEAAVVLAGLVTAVRRRGDTMAFVRIEDGRGQLEVAFFRDAFAEAAPMLSRDRLLLIEGGLGEDQFSGGLVLRARQCWDFRQLCAQHARRLAMTIDLRRPGVWDAVQQLLAPYRPGPTPLRLDLLTPGRARGTVDLDGPLGVRTEPELVGQLRALPGVDKVQLSLHRPWAQGG
ncbi:DNA polymerase III subunit alpha [Arenimonas composti]|uniref:DNA polymerase III subunit alpha n=2 Tax=Arenimonas TaxID=490567 RepID=A0A091BAE2_9GAMM|nr:DNA polymerase III subunit alpha [Arenimonas composti]KFN49638.1 hypothetical protein P873_09735 [Arenimonas composti TR7-09 = DSM 18010]